MSNTKRDYLIKLLFTSILTPSLSLWAVDAEYDFNLDAKFIFIDEVSSPASAYSEGLTRLATDPASKERSTVGLQQLRFRGLWEKSNNYALNVSLRPDAFRNADPGGSQLVAREFDTRVGRVYTDMPSVLLLDAYSLDLRLWDTFYLSLGVFERFFQEWYEHADTLEFGLTVHDPRKFSAIRFHWNSNTVKEHHAQEDEKYRGLEADFWMIQGDDDRASQVSRTEDDLESRFVSKDPYQYTGLSVSYRGSIVNASTSLAIGSVKDRNWTEEEAGESSATVDNLTSSNGLKRSQMYAQATGALRPDPEWPVWIGADYRFLEENWSNQPIDFKARYHQSLRASALYITQQKDEFTLALFWSKSRFTSASYYNGYQLDLGYAKDIREDTRLGVLLSEEIRKKITDGVETDGFEDVGESGATSSRHRFAITLALEM